MTSIAVLAMPGDKQSAAALGRIVANVLVSAAAVAGPPGAGKSLNRIHTLGATTLRSAAAVVEALRWFESTKATHLIWALTRRVELTAGTLQRLTQVADDSKAAILYS